MNAIATHVYYMLAFVEYSQALLLTPASYLNN
jgi:hypothetical protein